MRKQDKSENISANKSSEMQQAANFFFGSIRNLNAITRYANRLKSSKETVAAHVYYVSIYSMTLAKLIDKEIKVDYSKLYSLAMLHDIEECISGDIVRTLKIKMSEAFKQFSELSASTILDDLPEDIKKEYLDNWKTDDGSIESKIVKISDELSGIAYCIEQISLGNTYFNNILNGYLVNLETYTKGTPFSYLYPIIVGSVLSKIHIFHAEKTSTADR